MLVVPRRFAFAAVLLVMASSAIAQSPAALFFDPFTPPFQFERPAAPKRYEPRFGLQLNPGPFVSKYLNQPDAAPTEPRDGPFNDRGALLDDGPNTRAFWNASADLDLAITMRLFRRSGLMLGYSPSARGRFTPRNGGTPALYFLQIRYRW